jgi:tRNA-guanine family transglycosylase
VTTSSPLAFSISARSTRSRARRGRVQTLHGCFDTPAFMPVGTRGSIKGILPNLVAQTGAQILLNNTYHLMLRPGSPLIKQMGGVHRFMNWNGPILTDSGGYQAYSLADTNKVDDHAVTFKSIIDGATVVLTPELAMLTQNELGPDIMMALDDCPPSVSPDAIAIDPAQERRLTNAAARDAGSGAAGSSDTSRSSSKSKKSPTLRSRQTPRYRQRTHRPLARTLQSCPRKAI